MVLHGRGCLYVILKSWCDNCMHCLKCSACTSGDPLATGSSHPLIRSLGNRSSINRLLGSRISLPGSVSALICAKLPDSEIKNAIGIGHR